MAVLPRATNGKHQHPHLPASGLDQRHVFHAFGLAGSHQRHQFLQRSHPAAPDEFLRRNVDGGTAGAHRRLSEEPNGRCRPPPSQHFTLRSGRHQLIEYLPFLAQNVAHVVQLLQVAQTPGTAHRLRFGSRMRSTGRRHADQCAPVRPLHSALRLR